MRLLLALLVVSTALFTACSSTVMQSKLPELQGQPLEAAIAKLGMPSDERVIAGRKVYIWYTSGVTDGTQYKCQIRAIMNGDVIGSFDWEAGNEGLLLGPCTRYAQRLLN